MLFFAIFLSIGLSMAVGESSYDEPHRNQFHFSPEQWWMNDPNGLVLHNGIYHMFFQYNPNLTVTGSVHWGHATSGDLIHWKEEPIALYPDDLGLIFSGSAVVDTHNSTGFSVDGEVPIVAIFTSHSTVEGAALPEAQSLAYSLDNGTTFTKYSGNPVLTSPGSRDFRDPKVFWHAPQTEWIMSLAVGDKISFYSSPDLKQWTHESDFGGPAIGAHGGVWECPDLFPLTSEGQTVWVLLVSINPGGPNVGSATQYFIGDFDGTTFTPSTNDIRWIDYGTDDYAGVTFSDTGNRKILLGWMNNWMYAQQVPTVKWRGAMTIPRELALKEVEGILHLTMQPVREFAALEKPRKVFQGLSFTFGEGELQLNTVNNTLQSAQFRLDISTVNIADVSVELGNLAGDKVVVGYDSLSNQYFIDRTQSGKTNFADGFAAVQRGPRVSKQPTLQLTLIADVASVELFADGGLTCMTAIYFPNGPLNSVKLIAHRPLSLTRVAFSEISSIWR